LVRILKANYKKQIRGKRSGRELGKKCGGGGEAKRWAKLQSLAIRPNFGRYERLHYSPVDC